MTADAGRAAVERYFTEMGEIYRSGGGTDETSYYSAFDNLANAIGKDLKPKVRCIIQLRNTGAGNPDGGFYAAEQFRRGKDETPMDGQEPERGRWLAEYQVGDILYGRAKGIGRDIVIYLLPYFRDPIKHLEGIESV